jgi:hypothetical protein
MLHGIFFKIDPYDGLVFAVLAAGQYHLLCHADYGERQTKEEKDKWLHIEKSR